MNIVITGATQGLGKALTAEFLQAGDNVVICSRTKENVEQVIKEFANAGYQGKIFGIPCDVAEFSDIEQFGDFSMEHLHTIDIWINNAGTNGFDQLNLVDANPETIAMVVKTNLFGSLYGTKKALQIMQNQKYGHIFNAEGLGSNGMPSPKIAAYGATKAGIRQLIKTLVKETEGSPVGVHNFSPGMMLTDLLLKNSTVKSRKFYNILAERPETVAAFLAPRIRTVQGTGRRIKFLTTPKIMWRFLTAGFRKGRFFDDDGNPTVDMSFTPDGIKKE